MNWRTKLTNSRNVQVRLSSDLIDIEQSRFRTIQDIAYQVTNHTSVTERI